MKFKIELSKNNNIEKHWKKKTENITKGNKRNTEKNVINRLQINKLITVAK